MFQTSSIHLIKPEAHKRIEVLSRTIDPGPESSTGKFDSVEVRCFASGGADFSKIDILVPAQRGEALAEAFRKAIS